MCENISQSLTEICFLYLIMNINIQRIFTRLLVVSEGLLTILLAIIFMVIVYFAANEIDGKTLLKLTDNMISRLLPTMRQQVAFLDLQAALRVQSLVSAEAFESPLPLPDSLTVCDGFDLLEPSLDG